MYKMKRHSGATKRFKRLKSNLIKASHQGRRHNLSKKTRGRKRSLRKQFILQGGDANHLRKVL